MSKENQSSLRFSLEESIWFQKGQEVGELYSLSLDPDVVIQERDQYVVIKGTLNLTGEYRHDGNMEEMTEESNLHSFIPKTVQNVEVRENGLNEFTHHFPVDITIPNNRIESLTDVDVSIHTFDYFLPEKNCLKLSADLMITGIYGEQQIEPAYMEEDDLENEQERLYEQQFAETILENFELANSNEEADEEIEAEEVARTDNGEEITTEAVEKNPGWKFSEYDTDLEVTKDEAEVELYLPFEIEVRKDPVLEEPAAPATNVQTYEEVPLDEIVTEPVTETENNEPDSTFPYFTGHGTTERASHPIEETTVTEETEAVEKLEAPAPRTTYEARTRKQNEAKKQAEEEAKQAAKEHVSLTDFFGRKQEEELVKFKVCIVQQGDTIQSLAERYSIRTDLLLEKNELESSQELKEGQVLYIPKVAAFKK